MKNKKTELARIKNLIESDRLNTGDNFYELAVSDIGKLLKDYFDLISAPDMKIVKVGDSLAVTITAKAVRIKSFVNIPEI